MDAFLDRANAIAWTLTLVAILLGPAAILAYQQWKGQE